MKSIRKWSMILTALCLVALMAIPASAAKEPQVNTVEKPVDTGLGKDLWDVYAEYRLQIFDLRVEGSEKAIGVLGEHGCAIEGLQATLDTIGDQREPLSDALKNHDRKALKQVNQELAKLWKEFRKEAKESIRGCSAAGVSGAPDIGEMS